MQLPDVLLAPRGIRLLGRVADLLQHLAGIDLVPVVGRDIAFGEIFEHDEIEAVVVDDDGFDIRVLLGVDQVVEASRIRAADRDIVGRKGDGGFGDRQGDVALGHPWHGADLVALLLQGHDRLIGQRHGHGREKQGRDEQRLHESPQFKALLYHFRLPGPCRSAILTNCQWKSRER